MTQYIPWYLLKCDLCPFYYLDGGKLLKCWSDRPENFVHAHFLLMPERDDKNVALFRWLSICSVCMLFRLFSHPCPAATCRKQPSKVHKQGKHWITNSIKLNKVFQAQNVSIMCGKQPSAIHIIANHIPMDKGWFLLALSGELVYTQSLFPARQISLEHHFLMPYPVKCDRHSKSMYFVILVQNNVTLCNMIFTVDFQTETRRYSLRQGTRKSYKDLEVEDDDIYVCKYRVSYFIHSLHTKHYFS